MGQGDYSSSSVGRKDLLLSNSVEPTVSRHLERSLLSISGYVFSELAVLSCILAQTKLDLPIPHKTASNFGIFFLRLLMS